MMLRRISWLLLALGIAACNVSNETTLPTAESTLEATAEVAALDPTATVPEATAVPPTATIVQELACPVIIEQAIEAANERCQSMGRNQTCYGNYTLQAQPRAGVTLPFDKPGDVVNLSDIESLSLTAFDQTRQEWGVALLKVQADVPDTLPGQNVTLVLFGNTQIEDKSTDAARPMQAFYFRSGIGDAPCSGVPGDGILIQTPEGVGEIHLTINEAQITLSSTAFIQAQPNAEMVISVVEGQAEVTAFDKTVIVPAGARTRTTLSSSGAVAAPPADAEPLDAEALRALPIDVLPEKIEIANPIDINDLRQFIAPVDTTLDTPFEERLVRAGWIGEGESGRLGKITTAYVVFESAARGRLTGIVTWTVPQLKDQLNSASIAGSYYTNRDELPLQSGSANPWAAIPGWDGDDVIAWLMWNNLPDGALGDIPADSVFAFVLTQGGELRGGQYFSSTNLEKFDATFTYFGFNFGDEPAQ